MKHEAIRTDTLDIIGEKLALMHEDWQKHHVLTTLAKHRE